MNYLSKLAIRPVVLLLTVNIIKVIVLIPHAAKSC